MYFRLSSCGFNVLVLLLKIVKTMTFIGMLPDSHIFTNKITSDVFSSLHIDV